MAKSHVNGKKHEAIARARVLQTSDDKPFVEILIATGIPISDEKRLCLLVNRLLKEVGRVECETVAMDALDVDFAFRKISTTEQHHSKD